MNGIINSKPIYDIYRFCLLQACFQLINLTGKIWLHIVRIINLASLLDFLQKRKKTIPILQSIYNKDAVVSCNFKYRDGTNILFLNLEK